MLWGVVLFVLLSVGCHPSRADRYLRAELSFLVPYVDVQQEARAVQRALVQRTLVVERMLELPSLVVLTASSVDGARSAVRIITPRGVVLAEDADASDPFSAVRVTFDVVPNIGPNRELLLSVALTHRRHADGCAQLYRVLSDGRLQPITLSIERFGAWACASAFRRSARGELVATIAWPSLAEHELPFLDVELTFASEKLDRPDLALRTLVVVDQGAWLEREAARLARPLDMFASFEARHARAVAQAALALARGESAEGQLARYRSALGFVLPHSPDAALVAEVAAHIEHGWLEVATEAASAPISDSDIVIEAASDAPTEDAAQRSADALPAAQPAP